MGEAMIPDSPSRSWSRTPSSMGDCDRIQNTVRLVIEADEDAVRVEVEQPTMANEVRVVEPRLDVPERIGGFGLRLVEEVADAWGYEAGPPGRVWCEFRR